MTTRRSNPPGKLTALGSGGKRFDTDDFLDVWWSLYPDSYTSHWIKTDNGDGMIARLKKFDRILYTQILQATLNPNWRAKLRKRINEAIRKEAEIKAKRK